MTVNIIVREEHAELLNKACLGLIDINDDNFKVDWSIYSNYAKGFLTVSIPYEIYVELLDATNEN